MHIMRPRDCVQVPVMGAGDIIGVVQGLVEAVIQDTSAQHMMPFAIGRYRIGALAKTWRE